MALLSKTEIEARINDMGDSGGYLDVKYEASPTKAHEISLTFMQPIPEGGGYQGGTIRVPLRRLASILAAAQAVRD